MTEQDRDLAEFRHQVDRIHKATPGAVDAPADLWSQVLAQATPTSKEIPTMSSITAPVNMGAPKVITPRRHLRRMGHYVNLVATIAIVATIAVGGWFAAMQLNAPGTPEPRFAVLGIQPEEAGNGVCDVEPLTVDEAIRIMRNPMEYLGRNLDADLENPLLTDEFNGNFAVVGNIRWEFMVSYIGELSIPVVETEFDSAVLTANEFLDCSYSGTKGEVYRLLDPVVVQSLLVNQMPVFVSEEDARVKIAAIFSEPAFASMQGGEINLRGVVNQNPELARYVAMNHLMHSGGFYTIPLMWTDENGDTVGETDVYGDVVAGELPTSIWPYNIVVSKSNLDLNWYVTGTFSPHFYPVPKTD